MGDMLIRDVPDAMKSDIAARAERNGTSLSDEAKDLLQHALADKNIPPETSGMSAYEAIRSAFERAGAIDDEFSAVMDEVEAQRKIIYWRPMEDLE